MLETDKHIQEKPTTWNVEKIIKGQHKIFQEEVLKVADGKSEITDEEFHTAFDRAFDRHNKETEEKLKAMFGL